MTDVPSYQLNDGRPIPAIGFGTYPLDDAAAAEAVAHVLRLGYRLVDTAANYRNEKGVGEGIARSGVDRADVVVTTKLPGRDHGYEETLASFEASRARLGLDHVDLYLIHWPLPRLDAYVASWRAMIKLRDEGVVGSIGVSNFTREHIDRLERETGVLPAVNQIELHPYLPQQPMLAYDAAKEIVTESWSPLARAGQLLQEPAVLEIAQRHGVSPGQIVLRWHIQVGAVPIPKSGDPRRQRENLDVFGFELTTQEMAAVSALGRPDGRTGGDPESHEEF
jgi:2,5-diketo-D-gluconate reductase A